MSTDQVQVTDEEYQAGAQRFTALIDEFEALPDPYLREKVFDLLQAVDVIHRAGLSRLAGFLRAQGHDRLLHQAAEDEIVGTLLVLYDLLPDSELTQAEAALEIVGFENIIPLTPTHGAAPNATAQRAPAAPLRPIFLDAVRLDGLPSGETVTVDVERVRVLIANVEGEIYAVRANCPGSMAPLGLGNFTPPVIVCPWHNEPYDIRTGLRVDGLTEPRLQVVPVAVTEGMIRVAVNTVAEAG